MTHIHVLFDGKPVQPGETFTPFPDTHPEYTMLFDRVDEDGRVILADCCGEFIRTDLPPVAEQPQRPTLGDRHTVIEVADGAEPDEGGQVVYVLEHWLCVPGGWEVVKRARVRGRAGVAVGEYDDIDEIGDSRLRRAALRMWHGANPIVARRAQTQLAVLALNVQLQTGTGEAGGWDDPATALRLADLAGATAKGQ